MKALCIALGATIAPFGDAPLDGWFATQTFRENLHASLSRRGIEWVDVGVDSKIPDFDDDVVVFADHCFVTDKCLGDFLSLAFGQEQAMRLALCRTPASEYARPASTILVEKLDDSGLGSLPDGVKRTEAEASERCTYDMWFAPKGRLPTASTAKELLQALQGAQRLVVPKKEIGVEVRLPLLGEKERSQMIFPITSTVACHLQSWVHILWMNQLAFGIRWNELARAEKLWCTTRLLVAAPWSMPRILKSFVRKGKNVRVHPTAHVEGSILGDNVIIGARASVRNSVLGDGVEIGDHATVIASTIGDNAYVTPKTFFVWSASYPDTVINNYKIQMSLLGRGAATSQWAGLIDAKFQGAIDIFVDGEKRSTERAFLGSCIGHGGYIGAKVLMLPGRELPNDAFVTMRPDELIREIPEEFDAKIPMMRDHGTLIPVDTGTKRLEPST
ncbi:MAG: hypothetical protein GY822_25425 [Deltaproteobacteria bacterium]|nr:hypothetical protein [Deltaproteobacteria bacterium]